MASPGGAAPAAARPQLLRADIWVFLGGRVDPDDLELDHARHAAGPSTREWAEALAVQNPREAAGYVVAALRETWEETGILVSTGAAGGLARSRELPPSIVNTLRGLEDS